MSRAVASNTDYRLVCATIRFGGVYEDEDGLDHAILHKRPDDQDVRKFLALGHVYEEALDAAFAYDWFLSLVRLI